MKPWRDVKLLSREKISQTNETLHSFLPLPTTKNETLAKCEAGCQERRLAQTMVKDRQTDRYRHTHMSEPAVGPQQQLYHNNCIQNSNNTAIYNRVYSKETVSQDFH
jgi:hypothetical protein